MRKSDFWYDLPQELIAQTPVEPRDSSRLMALNRQSGNIDHRHFHDLVELLREGDLLVVNNSRVLPARLYGTSAGGGHIEVLLLEQKENLVWEIIGKPGKKLREGAQISFGNKIMVGTVAEVLDNGNRIMQFACDRDFYACLDEIGHIPLPHYITGELSDRERYQTVYSNPVGSAAAPTAGLHFTEGLMNKLKQKGVDFAYITLHIGLGTFRPVKVEDITQHTMHSEHYHIPEEAARKINRAKQEGRRVISVGTTSTRTIESVSSPEGFVTAGGGYTNIFIYPGYAFKAIDGLITNFHLPESTLIMLVSALAGYDNTINAYRAAVKEKYRFYSFGDAMFVV